MFDSYIFVDWSAANMPSPVNPTEDSPWVGELTPVEQRNPVETYHRTRQCAIGHVLQRLLHHVGLNRRVLVGFDFPYGYPHGFAQALGLHNNGAAWQNIWAYLFGQITDNHRNVNNRFQVASNMNNIMSEGREVRVGPFWCCPAGNVTPHLETTKANAIATQQALGLHEFRLCEQLLLPGVHSTWQLYTPGSVGSQTLMGIPRLHYLRDHPDHPALAGCSHVWPFETGFAPIAFPVQGPFVLHAEIWPGIPEVEAIVQAILLVNPLIIKDRAQVRAMCQWAHQRDQQNQLESLFNVPAILNDAQVTQCEQEEGWILGL